MKFKQWLFTEDSSQCTRITSMAIEGFLNNWFGRGSKNASIFTAKEFMDEIEWRPLGIFNSEYWILQVFNGNWDLFDSARNSCNILIRHPNGGIWFNEANPYFQSWIENH